VPYTGYDEHVAIQKGTEIGAAKLWYDKPKKQFYLLVSLELETADPTPKTHTGVVGVDVGVRYLAVTATRRGEQSFYTGKRVVPKANHYARLRKRLQKKGTRSVTCRLVAISQRERRLKADANHTVSKRIGMMYPRSLISMEEMTGIRERTKRRKGSQRGASAKIRPVAVESRYKPIFPLGRE
jgi:transposase